MSVISVAHRGSWRRPRRAWDGSAPKALAARNLEQRFEKSGTTAGEGFGASLAAGMMAGFGHADFSSVSGILSSGAAAPSRRRYLLPGGASANNGDGLRLTQQLRLPLVPPRHAGDEAMMRAAERVPGNGGSGRVVRG